MVLRSAPKATSQASRRNVGHIFEKNGTISEKWMTLAAILGFSWAPGGVPKSIFGAKSFQNLKNDIQNEVSKKALIGKIFLKDICPFALEKNQFWCF